MAAEELTVAQKLQALFELQKIDSKINEIQVLQGELPIELKDLSDEMEGLTTRMKNHTDAIKGFEADISRFKANAKDCDMLVGKYTKQQENVKNDREFQALAKEIEDQKLEIQICDKKQKEIKLKIAERNVQLEATKVRMELKVAEHANKKVELERIIKETEAEQKEIEARSEVARETIEERLLVSYDKIRAAYRNSLAVVKVSRNACGGCFSKIPTQTQTAIAQRTKIIVCENCGRILVDDNIDVEIEAIIEA